MKCWDFPHGANLPGMPDFCQVEHCSTSIDDVLCHFRKRGTRKTAQPVPISHCRFPLWVWERISSHFLTFLHLRGSRDTRNTTRRSGPWDLVGLVSASRSFASSASSTSATPSGSSVSRICLSRSYLSYLSSYVASSCDEDTLCVWSRVASSEA